MRDRFAAAGLDNAALDARLLGEKAFGCDGLNLTLRENEIAPLQGLSALDALALRRLGGEPVARLIGSKEFYGLQFGLNAATLVPRPETELLVDLGLEAIKTIERPRLLDLGTGTGCIAISLLTTLMQATGLATDISAEALEMARANAIALDVAPRLTLCQGPWFAPIDPDDRFDLIVSNPPYIPAADIAGLQAEVRVHDPILALDGGVDGLVQYHAIAHGALVQLVAGGLLAVECGIGQAEDIARLFTHRGFERVKTHDDLGGIARVVTGFAPKP